MYLNVVENMIHFFFSKNIFLKEREQLDKTLCCNTDRINGYTDTEFDMASFFASSNCLLYPSIILYSYTVNNIVRVRE